jgi:hypothetical protein
VRLGGWTWREENPQMSDREWFHEVHYQRYRRQYVRRGNIPYYTKASLRRAKERALQRMSELRFE